MKVQQHGHETYVVPPRGRQQRVDVGKGGVIQAGGHAVTIEPHAGSRVAQEEGAHIGTPSAAMVANVRSSRSSAAGRALNPPRGNQALAPTSVP